MTRCTLAILATLVAHAGAASAQGKLEYQGTEFFRFFLYKNNLEPRESIQEALLSPKDTVIVCVGKVEWINRDVWGFSLLDFVRKGGSVLIATDTQCASKRDNSWERQFGIEITGRLLTADENALADGVAGRPLVLPRLGLDDRGPDSPFAMFAGIASDLPNAVSTDHPSEMTLLKDVRRPGMTVNRLARYPSSAKQIVTGRRADEDFDNFAVAMRVDGGGRFLAVADHSVFVNGQMNHQRTPPR